MSNQQTESPVFAQTKWLDISLSFANVSWALFLTARVYSKSPENQQGD